MMWELIRANQQKSLWLFCGMGAILLILGYLVGAVWFEGGGVAGIGIALIIWMVMAGVSYYSGDSILLSINSADEIPKELYPQLYNVVEEMCIAAGLKSIPRIFVLDDPNLNAFAVGRNPENSAIAVTSGLLSELNRDELQGVIAHEISHIFNRDSLFMTFAGVMLGSIQMISEVFLRSFPGSRRRRSSRSSASGYIVVIALIFAIIGPVLAQVLYFAISRKREYLADASAVRLTRYPEGLASALDKISKNGLISNVNRISAPLYISNPLSKQTFGFGDTHPPIMERIAILRSLATGVDFKSYQQTYQRVTKSEKRIIPTVALYRGETIPIRTGSANTEPVIANKVLRKDIGDLVRAINHFAFVNCSCGMKIKVPPEYSEPVIKCPRCGEMRVSPFAKLEKNETRKVNPVSQIYQRKVEGWESFNCACGRMLQLSPIFIGTSLTCPGCGSHIQIEKIEGTEKKGSAS